MEGAAGSEGPNSTFKGWLDKTDEGLGHSLESQQFAALNGGLRNKCSLSLRKGIDGREGP